MRSSPSRSRKPASVAPDTRPAARPYDGVKLELGVALVAAMAAGITVFAMDAPAWMELLLVAAVGFGCGGWIAVRTHGVARRLDADDPERTAASDD